MSQDSDPRKLPPLNALKAFEAAARLSSVSLAAKELSVTPGAVSQQVRLLEDHAGGPLVRREAGGLVLTELGARLQPVLRDAFEHMKRAADIIYGPSRRQSLSVSVPPSFAVRWLVPRMARFSAQHPEIEIWIPADMQLADIAGGRADVAVRYGQGDYPGVRTEVLVEAGVIPICSPSLLHGPKPLATPADLINHTLIHVGRSTLEEPRPDWAAWLGSRRLRHRGRCPWSRRGAGPARLRRRRSGVRSSGCAVRRRISGDGQRLSSDHTSRRPAAGSPGLRRLAAG